jgi:hypothetical protein
LSYVDVCHDLTFLVVAVKLGIRLSSGLLAAALTQMPLDPLNFAIQYVVAMRRAVVDGGIKTRLLILDVAVRLYIDASLISPGYVFPPPCSKTVDRRVAMVCVPS